MSKPQLTDDCWHACYHDGDIDEVRGFLAASVDINERAPCSDACPLDAALHGEHVPLARFLIEAGADVDGIGYGDGTPLMAAVNYQLTEAVSLLLEHDADPNVKAAVGVVTPSLASGTTVIGETPLHWAAAFGGQQMMRLLLDAGAGQDGDGCPRGYAADVLRATSADLASRHGRGRHSRPAGVSHTSVSPQSTSLCPASRFHTYGASRMRRSSELQSSSAPCEGRG